MPAAAFLKLGRRIQTSLSAIREERRTPMVGRAEVLAPGPGVLFEIGPGLRKKAIRDPGTPILDPHRTSISRYPDVPRNLLRPSTGQGFP